MPLFPLPDEQFLQLRFVYIGNPIDDVVFVKRSSAGGAAAPNVLLCQADNSFDRSTMASPLNRRPVTDRIFLFAYTSIALPFVGPAILRRPNGNLPRTNSRMPVPDGVISVYVLNSSMIASAMLHFLRLHVAAVVEVDANYAVTVQSKRKESVTIDGANGVIKTDPVPGRCTSLCDR